MKIMVIDDVMMNILVLKQAAKPFGAVDGFQSWEPGLDALREAYGSGEPYDLLFLDIRMPNRNGLEVLKDVQDLGRTQAAGHKTKVVMFTSISEPDSVREAIRLGAVGYVLKPIQAERIQDEVRRLMAIVGEEKPEAA
jgi:two-component system, chemotaxis family, chemotaxis protein CheY